MAQSSNNAQVPTIVWLDRFALGGIALGIALYVLPLTEGGTLKAGFWITFAFTILHIYTSHAVGGAKVNDANDP